MKIVALLENTTKNCDLEPRHGLSLYVETKKHKLLVDAGGGEEFARNARKLGVDLAAVDIAVITHGHSDHGGGLKRFLDINKTAKVYIQASAFEPYYKKIKGFIKAYIGLDKKLKNNPQIVLVNGDMRIDDGICLITNPSQNDLMPKFNASLLEKDGKKVIKDRFNHEQSVIITENKTVLIGGCAHRGIANIIKDAQLKIKKPVDVCVSGFHLFDPVSGAVEHEDVIKQLSKLLLAGCTQYYVCHCTGVKAYEILKTLMKDRINYLATGDVLEVR